MVLRMTANNLWTKREEQELTRLHQKFDTPSCMLIMGRTESSIKCKVNELGLVSPRPSVGKQRIYYAEDVANMMQLKESGLSNSEIALSYKSAAKTICDVMTKAKRLGFQAYPLRVAAKAALMEAVRQV